MSSYELRNKDYEVFARCNCTIGIGKSKLHLTLHLVSKKKKKKGLFGDTLSLTTSHLLLLDVTPVKNIKNTEMAIKILKNGKKILKAPSQGWRHCNFKFKGFIIMFSFFVTVAEGAEGPSSGFEVCWTQWREVTRSHGQFLCIITLYWFTTNKIILFSTLPMSDSFTKKTVAAPVE